MSACSLCGCMEFFLEAGYYYCVQCQTQIEDAQEEVHEYSYVYTANSSQKKIKLKERKEKISENRAGEQRTSWEMYNILLKGFVDQMIALGASKDLKPVVLQLWTSYLAHIEVAFHNQKSIKFNLGYKKRDVELLSGKKFKEFAEKRKKRVELKVRRKKELGVKRKGLKNGKRGLTIKEEKRKKKIEEVKMFEGTAQLTKLKRKIMESQLSEMKSQDERNFIESSQLQSQSQTLENLTQKNEESELLDRFQLNKNSCSLINALKVNWVQLSQNKRKELLESMVASHSASAYNLTLRKLIGILQLGMVLSNQDAQIGDTLRWMSEGHLSYEDATVLFPLDMDTSSFQNILHDRKMSHVAIRVNLRRMAEVLSVNLIPAPNFFKLTARYCLELQLPDEILLKVNKLLLLYPPKEKFSEVTSLEARAMSYVIVVLKLYFGLDGVTENAFSEVADFLNRSSGSKTRSEKRFFSWTEWVKFMECRKAVVAHFHYPTRIAVTKGHYALGNPYAFSTYWQKRHASYLRKPEHPENIFGEDIESTLNDLSRMSKNSDDLDFPASLTPMVSYTNELLSKHNDKLDQDACNILRQSFTSLSLLHPKMFRRLNKFVAIVEKKSSMRCMEKIPKILPLSVPHSFPSVLVNTLVIKENPNTSISLKRKWSDRDESLSRITDRLLKKRLVEVKGQLKEKFNDISCTETKDSGNKKFFWNEVFQHYWYLHGNIYQCRRPMDNEDFYEFSQKMFSSSFFWLLKECSRLIGVIPRELYYEVVNTEIRLT